MSSDLVSFIAISAMIFGVVSLLVQLFKKFRKAKSESKIKISVDGGDPFEIDLSELDLEKLEREIRERAKRR